jgi:hypothetical protein
MTIMTNKERDIRVHVYVEDEINVGITTKRKEIKAHAIKVKTEN